MELGITGQCFLSNLKASKNLPYSWISRQKCWVAAFHDVRLNSLNWDVNCKAVWLNHSSRSRDKHLGCMLSELHNCIYRSVTWSCHRDMCSATTSVLLRDMRLLHDYQQFSFRSFISAAASTNQKVSFHLIGDVFERVRGSKRTFCPVWSIFEKALWNTLIYDSQVMRKVQPGCRRWGQ